MAPRSASTGTDDRGGRRQSPEHDATEHTDGHGSSDRRGTNGGSTPTRRSFLGAIAGIPGLAAGPPGPPARLGGGETAGALQAGTGFGLLGWPGGVGPMTIERPTQDAQCWFVNGADRSVDVYVNYRDSPWTAISPSEDGPVFSIDSDASRLYGTYTFEIRDDGDDPDEPPLASVSAEFRRGDSYTAVIHRVGEADYELSIYRNDFTPSANSRFVIRHNAYHREVDWRMAPKSEADPRIEVDTRSGHLERGQWQAAYDVVPNEYRLEILVDGDVVAFRQDLELESNRVITCYVVGNPQWWMGSDQKEGHIRRDEFQIQTGEQRPDVVTDPAPPHATTDRNQGIHFDVHPQSFYHTNRQEIEVGATDPDGIVSGLAVDDVSPSTDGMKIPDESIDPAMAFGGETTGTLDIRPKVPPADYEVTIVANPETLGERATTTMPITVLEITPERLADLVERYYEAGDIAEEFVDDLRTAIQDAETHLQNRERKQACQALKRVKTVVGEYKDAGIDQAAALDIETETEGLRKRLGCG